MTSRFVRYQMRRLRVRSKVFGTPDRPRLSVYRSLSHVYAQVIDDVQGRTIAASSSREKGFSEKAKTEAAQLVGAALAKRALEKGIKRVVFDRGARVYHGRVKAVAEGARGAGLEF